MTTESHNLPVHRPAEPLAVAPAQPPARQEDPSPVQRVHRLLRGHYKWVVPLALLLGIGGAYLGWRLWSPSYESRAQIRVAPVLPRILYRSEQNDVMPMYDGYIDSQVALMQSNRVISLAMKKNRWTSLSDRTGEQAMHDFANSLKFERPRGSQVVTIGFSHSHPATAKAGVESVVESYMEIFGEEDMRRQEMRLKVLEQRRAKLQGQLDTLRGDIMEVAREHGTESLEDDYQFKLAEVHKIESSLKDLDLLIAETEALAGTHNDSLPEGPHWMSAHEIQLNDRTMEQYFHQKRQIQIELALLKNYRTDENPLVKIKQRELDSVNDLINDYEMEYNAYVPAEDPEETPGQRAQRQLTVLKERRARTIELLENARQESLVMGRDALAISNLREQIEQVQTLLEETEMRMEQLNVEEPVSGRITVVSSGELPVTPANDGQRVQMAIAGGGGMAAMTVAGILFLIAGRRRFRYVDDAQQSLAESPVLGVLPHLNPQLDREEAAFATLAVHQMRTMLQMGPMAEGKKVFAVTSAGTGDGKTSLVTALGLSMAGTGLRCLLIDFDMLGRGLTNRVNRRMRLGDMLVEGKYITARQRDRCLHDAASRGRRLGEVVRDWQLAPAEVVDDLLKQQEQAGHGLADALRGRPLSATVHKGLGENLHVLTAGVTTNRDLGQISPAQVQLLLRDVRKQYDVVFVDCGPLTASLDASLVAPQADGVLFVVARGARRPDVQSAVGQLRRMNAPLTGLVFNRAHPEDFRHYSSSYEDRANMNRAQPPITPETDIDIRRLGPVAHAMASNAMSN